MKWNSTISSLILYNIEEILRTTEYLESFYQDSKKKTFQLHCYNLMSFS